MDPKQKKFFKKFGAEVRKVRLETGMTLEDMQSFGFSAQHFQKIESGQKAINLYTAHRISKAFKIRIDDLI
ncbi:MAG: helix-turn-helix transcriptional regulator [Pseudomonadota bacterium]